MSRIRPGHIFSEAVSKVPEISFATKAQKHEGIGRKILCAFPEWPEQAAHPWQIALLIQPQDVKNIPATGKKINQLQEIATIDIFYIDGARQAFTSNPLAA